MIHSDSLGLSLMLLESPVDDDLYNGSCEDAESAIQKAIGNELANKLKLVASVIRFQFHDSSDFKHNSSDTVACDPV
ncbi:hypothetical protein MPTK1_6g13530 [Marchantia polymorpha subsp. ruderalis]|uniref:Uncharacterized protein n=2 Tax=Marchantia polymorpha TaxID=3197 RepID=A0AAF6BRP0_MARPO|nr:hypothetical protein MARPO_0047s0005 [Marchantia polymorpha]BBN14674.1 hypothetical protein Mp_6g13530 [Marchantia polymorpha subsp. ruderalis]|eukprot:PTQ39013.1 hypothetical protein MARPO_0047s0005 [Marchantia polymorpha]